MAKALRIEDVSQDPPREIGALRSARITIGRDPEFGLHVDSPAVSRQHGVFVPQQNHWFFMDMESTNGSWINDRRIPANTMKIVRSGDFIQIADAIIRVSSLGEEARDDAMLTAEGMWSLVIFSEGDFKDEFPVPKSGKALIVGGKQGDIQFPDESAGRIQEEPTAVFDRRKDGLYVFQVDTSRQVLLNEEPLQRSTRLEDNDSVQVENFTILFNCPPLSKRKTHEWAPSEVKMQKQEQEQEQEVPPQDEWTLKTWGSDTQGQQPEPVGAMHEIRRGAINPVFGKKPVAKPESTEEAGGPLTGAPLRDPNSTTTKIYTQGPIRREVYQSSRREDYEEEEGLSPYKILIAVFAVLSLLLLIAVASVLLGY